MHKLLVVNELHSNELLTKWRSVCCSSVLIKTPIFPILTTRLFSFDAVPVRHSVESSRCCIVTFKGRSCDYCTSSHRQEKGKISPAAMSPLVFDGIVVFRKCYWNRNKLCFVLFCFGWFGDYIKWWSDTHLVLQRVFHRSGGLKMCPLFLPIKKMALSATLRLTDVFLIVFGQERSSVAWGNPC